jgi:anti-anti-sigma regulatory factor
MLRITRTESSPSHVLLKAEGQIIAEWVALLEGECRKLLEADQRVVLDLGAVTYLDRNAIHVLRTLNAGNLSFSNCSPLIEELLTEETL